MKRFRAFLVYFMITNLLLLILKKKLNFLIYVLQSNVHYQRTIISYQKICYLLLKNVFPMESEKVNVVPPPKKKKINNASKTTDLSLCFRSAVRSFKDFYLTNCRSFLMKMSYYYPTSQVLSPTKYINLLIMISR